MCFTRCKALVQALRHLPLARKAWRRRLVSMSIYWASDLQYALASAQLKRAQAPGLLEAMEIVKFLYWSLGDSPFFPEGFESTLTSQLEVKLCKMADQVTITQSIDINLHSLYYIFFNLYMSSIENLYLLNIEEGSIFFPQFQLFSTTTPWFFLIYRYKFILFVLYYFHHYHS